jgi:aryl-alcohol dehydrogenase-like predicted oxidoreductase
MEMRPGKPNGSGLSRKAVLSEIDKSLKRLRLDYVDLYTIHRLDPLTSMEELMEALHEVVKSGKARYIGASTMYAWQFERLQHIAERHGWTKFVAMQNHYNLMYREEEREMIPLCRDRQIALTPWSPLAGGRLAHAWGTVTPRVQIDEVSKWVWDSTNDLDKVVIDNVEAMARARGISMAQLSLAWMLSKPYLTAPIVGMTAVAHVEEAVAALDLHLSDEDIQALEQPYVTHPVLGMM